MESICPIAERDEFFGSWSDFPSSVRLKLGQSNQRPSMTDALFLHEKLDRRRRIYLIGLVMQISSKKFTNYIYVYFEFKRKQQLVGFCILEFLCF